MLAFLERRLPFFRLNYCQDSQRQIVVIAETINSRINQVDLATSTS